MPSATPKSKPTPKPVAKPALKKPINTGTARTFSHEKEPELGQIEDLNRKFVRTDVPKRPLSSTGLEEVTKLKAQKIKDEKVLAKAVSTTQSNKKKSFKVPKPKFVNQEKVKKRPLSKNVYAKPIEQSNESKEVVTIITKPAKDPHINIVVTIIITIILGAAAGTVAFLILPK